MTDTPSDNHDPGAPSESETSASTVNASSTYKVLGEDALSSGAGVLGNNTAESGTPVGVEGAVPNNTSGYGLSTPHDANVGGTAELAALGGGVTGDSRLTSLTGDGLTLAAESLGVGPTNVTTDTASTFAESGVSVTHSNTTVTDGAIELGFSSAVSRPDDNNSGSFSDKKYGLEFEPQDDLSGIVATISSNTSGESTVKLYTSGGILLDSKPSPGAGNSVTLTSFLSAGTPYVIIVGNEGNTYTSGFYDNPSFPYTSSTIDITSGAYEESGNIFSDPNAHAIKSLGGMRYRGRRAWSSRRRRRCGGGRVSVSRPNTTARPSRCSSRPAATAGRRGRTGNRSPSAPERT